MKPDEIYTDWKKKKNEIEVSPGFSERVMNQIHHYERQQSTGLFSKENLAALLSHRLAKPILIAGSLALGICRILFLLRFSLG